MAPLFLLLAAAAAAQPAAELRGGGRMPLLGFGALSGLRQTYLEAVQAGYRHFDTAFDHRNHALLGEALRATNVSREELFVTSKVSSALSSYRWGPLTLPKPFSEPSLQDPAAGGGALAKGRELEGLLLARSELGLDYLDLCLVHRAASTPVEVLAAFWPHWFLSGRVRSVLLYRGVQLWLDALVRLEAALAGEGRSREARRASWRHLEAAKRQGVCRHIGVSNYPLGALEEMEGYAEIAPEVLQVEHTPICQQRALLAFAGRKGMAVTGYGSAAMTWNLQQIHEVARRLGRSPNAVLLRWRLQKGVGLLQGSFHPGHMRENLGAADWVLPEAEVAFLDSAQQGEDFPLYWAASWFAARRQPLAASIAVLSAPFLAATGALLAARCCCRALCGGRRGKED